MMEFAPVGRVVARSTLVMATSRPSRSYQGPAPTRSIALTALPLPPSMTLKKARHVLPLLGMLRSARAAQILSAPRRPAPVPVSPKRRSPPKPAGFPEAACSPAMLVTKKLNFSVEGFPAPLAPALLPPELLAPALPAPALLAPALPAPALLAPALPFAAPAEVP